MREAHSAAESDNRMRLLSTEILTRRLRALNRFLLTDAY